MSHGLAHHANLLSKLRAGCHYQDLRHTLGQVQPLERSDHETRGLARAGLCLQDAEKDAEKQQRVQGLTTLSDGRSPDGLLMLVFTAGLSFFAPVR